LENLKGRDHLEGLSRWEDNTGMDIREIGWEGVDWMHMAQEGDQWQAIMEMVVNLWVP
jgi:hypothetical protein